MKTLTLIAALAAAAMLSSCETTTQTVCKDGEYCAKCKTVFVQMGPLTKSSSTLMRKMTCPTCGSALTACSVCK